MSRQDDQNGSLLRDFAWFCYWRALRSRWWTGGKWSPKKFPRMCSLTSAARSSGPCSKGATSCTSKRWNCEYDTLYMARRGWRKYLFWLRWIRAICLFGVGRAYERLFTWLWWSGSRNLTWSTTCGWVIKTNTFSTVSCDFLGFPKLGRLTWSVVIDRGWPEILGYSGGNYFSKAENCFQVCERERLRNPEKNKKSSRFIWM